VVDLNWLAGREARRKAARRAAIAVAIILLAMMLFGTIARATDSSGTKTGSSVDLTTPQQKSSTRSRRRWTRSATTRSP